VLEILEAELKTTIKAEQKAKEEYQKGLKTLGEFGARKLKRNLVRAEEAQAIAAAAFLDGKKKVDAVKPKEIKRSSNGRGNKKVSNKATVQRKN